LTTSLDFRGLQGIGQWFLISLPPPQPMLNGLQQAVALNERAFTIAGRPTA
jgi:hypothetical protein